VIKQFNFYDIYGYLLPGMLLLGLFWLPFGVFTQTWPDEDISKALFLAALAYIVGHLLQIVANSVVPSKVTDSAERERYPSDMLLDQSNRRFSKQVKEKLSGQVKDLFGLALEITMDCDGKNDISKNRQTAFFQVRSYLTVKNHARYAEQFQGLYALMRGLACSFFAGAFYLIGWVLAFHRDNICFWATVLILFVIGIAGALVSSWAAWLRNKEKEAKKPGWKERFWLAPCLLLSLLCSGFWVGAKQPGAFWSQAPTAGYTLAASACFALIASAICLSAYRDYTFHFAKTVWLDFSAYRSFHEIPAPPSGDASDES
jgi:biotin transporter BioY